jgi:hypothetical protein
MTDKKIPESERVSGPEVPNESPRPRRSYSPPRLLSIEPLEAAAATCSPPTGGFGKAPPACNPRTLGS